MKFTLIGIENWRNFKTVEVELGERSFLVGPNAAGKSNFLDIFRFLADIARPGRGLQAALEVRGGLAKIRSLFARANSKVTVRVNVRNDFDWTYELRLTQSKGKPALVDREAVLRNGDLLVERPDDEDQRDPERLTQTYLEQVNANKAFRELTDFFSSTSYLHILPQVIREPQRMASVSNDAFGSDLLEKMAQLPKKRQSSRLSSINRALRSVVPQFGKLVLERDAKGAPHLKGLYEHWRPKGAWQSEEQFSDGTLRLIGLLWVLLEGSGPVLLEEPELSLNAAIIRRIPQLFARVAGKNGRQIVVSTHSAELLTDPGIAPEEILLLRPTKDGTEVYPASSIREIMVLLSQGIPAGEAVMPYAEPSNAEQLRFDF